MTTAVPLVARRPWIAAWDELGGGAHVSSPASAWRSAWSLAGSAGGVQGPGDLLVAEAGLAGGDRQGTEIGGRSASRARLAAQNRPALRFPSGWLATHWARWVRSRPRAGRVHRVLAAAGVPEAGDCIPVQAAAAAGPGDEVVGLAVHLGGRGHDVAACGAEVQVVAGQAAIVLVCAGEVGVHSAGRGPYVGGGAVGQSGAAEPGEGGEAVSGGAVLVDVQDVGAGGAGGDGQVPARSRGRTIR